MTGHKDIRTLMAHENIQALTSHEDIHALQADTHTLQVDPHTLQADTHTLQADFRAAVIQAIIDAGDDPEHPEIRSQIEKLEQEYAIHLEYSWIYISGKNRIEGFRQVVFLGPDYHNNRITGLSTGIAVTSDGRLIADKIGRRISNYRSPTTTIQATRTSVNKVPVSEGQVSEAPVNEAQVSEGPVSEELVNKAQVNKAQVSEEPFNIGQAIRVLTDLYKMISPTNPDGPAPDKPDPEFLNQHVAFNLDDPVMPGKFDSRVDSCELDPVIKNEIKHFLHQQVQERLAPVCRAITTSLDSNILRDMRQNTSMGVSVGYWLTGGDGVTMDVVTARQQAIRAYPFLSETFHKDPRFRNVIDTRASLSASISERFKVDRHRVKRFAGLTWQQIGSKPSRVPNGMLSDFLYLPDKCFPKTTEQFQHLDIFLEFGISLYDESLPEFTERLSNNGEPWRFIDRMKQTSGTDVFDAVDFLALKLVCPVMIYRDQPEISFERIMSKARYDILENFRFGELLDWSDRYHRNIAQYEDRLDIVSVNRDWPGMIGTIDLGNNCCARELTSSVSLKAQGRAENHCVGGYASTILNQKDHSKGQAVLVFSLEQNDRISSTVEIRCFLECSTQEQDEHRHRHQHQHQHQHQQDEHEHEQKKYERDKKYHLRTQVCQNKAYGNASPSSVSEDLADRIAVRLEQAGVESFRAYLDGLHEALAEQGRISKLEHYIAECGLDPRNRAHLEMVWNTLGPALPRRFRRDGLDVFIALGLSSREALKEPSPGM